MIYSLGGLDMAKDIREAKNLFKEAVLQRFEAAAHSYGEKFDASRSVVALAPSGVTIATAPSDTKGNSYLAYISRDSRKCRSNLQSGFYEIIIDGDSPKLYFQGPDCGRELVNFKPPETDPVMLSTPLGDWMCGNAPSLISDFCQTFVACAAYDLFCGGSGIP